MIRITTQQEQGYTVVIIDGLVEVEDLAEILRVRTSLTGEVVLNLRGVAACVDEGVHILRAWLDAGAGLQDATLYLRMILDQTQHAKE